MSNEPRFIEAGGKKVGADDEWWDQTTQAYEVDGVPSELVAMARPLLDGDARQQRQAHDFLMEQSGSWTNSAEAQVTLMRMLATEGFKAPDPGRTDEDDFLKAWDDQMGPAAGRSGAAFSLGTSKEAQGNRFAQGYGKGASGVDAAN